MGSIINPISLRVGNVGLYWTHVYSFFYNFSSYSILKAALVLIQILAKRFVHLLYAADFDISRDVSENTTFNLLFGNIGISVFGQGQSAVNVVIDLNDIPNLILRLGLPLSYKQYGL